MRDGASRKARSGAARVAKPEIIQDRPPRVLLATDARSSRLYESMLAGEGFEVETVSKGKSMAALLAKSPFDLVVSDITIPQMDGLKVLGAVHKRDPNLPVVFIAPKEMLNTVIQALDQGALRYLVKPVDAKVLLATANEAVRLRRIATIERLAFELYGRPNREDADRLDLDTRLSKAVDTIWMAYQPIVRCSRKAIVAYEALVRTDEQSLLRPYDLFQAAEKLNRLDYLGRVIRQAVASDQRLPERVDIYVNLRLEDLTDDDLFADDAPLSRMADRVVLEMSERRPLTTVPQARARISGLRRMGYRIALDDLGGGCSGLTSLGQMQPDVVKLDMSLIRDIGRDLMKQKLVEAMIQTCTDLGIAVICEGVHDREERDTLLALGGDLMQGYFFGKPSGIFPQAVAVEAFK